MTTGRRTPKVKPRVPWIQLPRLGCPQCDAVFVIETDRWPEHYVHDVPEWWGDPVCPASGRLIQRRQPKGKTWLAKYKAKRQAMKP